jgi:hypothetical protein
VPDVCIDLAVGDVLEVANVAGRAEHDVVVDEIPVELRCIEHAGGVDDGLLTPICTAIEIVGGFGAEILQGHFT